MMSVSTPLTSSNSKYNAKVIDLNKLSLQNNRKITRHSPRITHLVTHTLWSGIPGFDFLKVVLGR